jgi:hypothetical protein
VEFDGLDELVRTASTSVPRRDFEPSWFFRPSASPSSFYSPRVDLLVLDDFALEPMSKEKSEDVYQLFLERTGRASTILSSNHDTAEWLGMFDACLLRVPSIVSRTPPTLS